MLYFLVHDHMHIIYLSAGKILRASILICCGIATSKWKISLEGSLKLCCAAGDEFILANPAAVTNSALMGVARSELGILIMEGLCAAVTVPVWRYKGSGP